MTSVDLLGWLGVMSSCGLATPQLVKVLRLRCDLIALEGVARWSMTLIMMNAVSWLDWAVLTGEYLVGVPSLLNGPSAATALLFLHRGQRRFRLPPPVVAARASNV